MAGKLRIERNVSPWRFLLAWLCVLLVFMAGTAQVAHMHADGLAHADCSLCVAAHAAVDVVQAPVGVVPVTAVSTVEALPQSATPSAVTVFALFTRPPPMA